jgi:hypothetical protein
MKFTRKIALAGTLAVAFLGLSAPSTAQPYNAWLVLSGDPTSSFVEIPHAAGLNTPGNFTFEAWIDISNNVAGEDCRSIAGKNYLTGWWVGICNVGGLPTLRSYLKGGGSARNGGVLTRSSWTHIAVVYDKLAGKRLHYINGILAAEFAETGNLPTNTSPMRIASDVSWQHTPAGAIDEVRLWKLARTQAQLRQFINVHITAPKPVGLVAQWSLDANGNDTFNKRNGTVTNGAFLTFPAGPHCTSGPPSGSFACLNNRFSASLSHRDPTTGAVTQGTVVSTNSGDAAVLGVFGGWETLVKEVNGCGPNSRHWILASALAGYPLELSVFDTQAFQNKVYFFYPNSPFPNIPSIVDTDAFATCP